MHTYFVLLLLEEVTELSGVVGDSLGDYCISVEVVFEDLLVRVVSGHEAVGLVAVVIEIQTAHCCESFVEDYHDSKSTMDLLVEVGL